MQSRRKSVEAESAKNKAQKYEIVANLKLLKRHSKAKRRTPAYSQAQSLFMSTELIHEHRAYSRA